MPDASAAPEVGQHGSKLEFECARAGVPPFVRGSRQNHRQLCSFALVPPPKISPTPPSQCVGKTAAADLSLFFVRGGFEFLGYGRLAAGAGGVFRKHGWHTAVEGCPASIRSDALGFLQPFPQDLVIDKAPCILHGLDQGALVVARRRARSIKSRQPPQSAASPLGCISSRPRWTRTSSSRRGSSSSPCRGVPGRRPGSRVACPGSSANDGRRGRSGERPDRPACAAALRIIWRTGRLCRSPCRHTPD